MRKLTKVAAAVSSALLMGYGVSANADIVPFTPSAYAESTLNVTNFEITLAGGGSLIPLLGAEIQNLKANVGAIVSASLNGSSLADADSINPLVGSPTISIETSVGPGYAGSPFVSYGVGTLAPTTFAGAASEHFGNALRLPSGTIADPATTALTQAQVNINKSEAIGHADTRQNLATTFELDVVGPGLFFDVTFLASAFARIALGQPDVIAQIDRNWGLDVREVSNPLSPVILMSWEPDGNFGADTALSGVCKGLGTCFELADGFNMNIQAALQNTGDFEATEALKAFGVRVFLPGGSYQIAINHDVSADAQAVPEPGSLALLGAALLGFAGLRRKLNKA